MKKLIILLVVLGFAVTANAALITLSPVDVGLSEGRLGGADDPLLESDIIGLDIMYMPDGAQDLLSLATVVTAEGLGSLDASDLTFPYDEGFSGSEEVVAGKEYGMWTADFGGMGEGILIDHILFHCDGEGLVVVSLAPGVNPQIGPTLYIDGTTEYDGQWGSIEINQIPEPATIVLLGLGGLFLRRRK